MFTLTGHHGLSMLFSRKIMAAVLASSLVACGGGGADSAGVAADGNASTGGGSDVAENVGGGGEAPTDGVGATPEATDVMARTIAKLTNVGTAGLTYYVATTGGDSNDGLSLERPFQSVERALQAAGPGDTIEIKGGTYRPRGNGFPISRGGRADARIKMKAYNGEKVIFDAAGKNYAVYMDESAAHWILEGIEMSGGNQYTIKIDSPNVHMVKCNLHGSRNDVVKLVQSSNDVVLYANEIHHTSSGIGANAQGIDIVGADRVWIAHNYVHDLSSIGMYAKGNSRNIVFEHNRLENISSRAIMLGQSTDANLLWDGLYETYDSIIRNNIVINTTDACLATASSYNVKIYNNSCYMAATRSHGAIFVSNESERGQGGTNVEIRNNIVVSGGSPVFKVGPGAMTDDNTLIVDRNLYWSTAGAVTFKWEEDRGIVAVDINQWRSATQKDATSIVADPLYADAKTLKLSNDSPAIDAGVATDAVTDDYGHHARPQGAGIDIGAYELR